MQTEEKGYAGDVPASNQYQPLLTFNLDVAASTSDTTNGANNSYWGDARAPWSFNGNGTVGGPPAAFGGPGWVWTGSPAAGVTAPTGWAALPLTAEAYGAPSTFFNNQLQISTFTASATG